MDVVRTGLRELGYIEGRNLTVSYRYAEGEPERLPGLATDLVREKPDLLLAIGGDVAPHAVAATSTLPIVFATSSDPVQHGLVESLARPGRNATGVTFIQDDLASKRLEFFKEAVPVISRVAFLWNPDHLDNELREAQRAARNLGVQLHPIEMRGPRDLENAFRAITNSGSNGLYVVTSRQTLLNIPKIVKFAGERRVPLAGGFGGWARAGGILSYGPNVNEMTRLAAGYVEKYLRARGQAIFRFSNRPNLNL